MITIQPTIDEAYIKSVFLNDTVYCQMRDDTCPAKPALLFDRDIKSIPGFFLRVEKDATPAGIFWLVWKNADLEAHTALLENCRGRDAITAASKALDWCFGNTNVDRITSYAWSDSPSVQWFCRAVGLKETDRRDWPATRNGKPVSVINYETTRQLFRL